MEQTASRTTAVECLRETGQSLAYAIRVRDGDAALQLAKRYEQALHAALEEQDGSSRDTLIRETADWLQEKIVQATRIRAEIACEINEVEAQKTLMGQPRTPGSGESCSFSA